MLDPSKVISANTTSEVRASGASRAAVFAISFSIMLVIVFVDSFLPTGTVLVTPYLKHLFFMSLTYSILSLSLNIVTGYMGQISLGHAAFFGIGAFVSTVLTKYYGISFWVALPAAGIVAALIGIPLGMPAIRIKGPFLVVVTYGFGEVLRYVALNTDSLGGTSGIAGIPSPHLLESFARIGRSGKEAYIVVAFLLMWFLIQFVSRLEDSPTGLALSAIREDETAAAAMGVDPAYYKLLAFSLSAGFAGLAGSLYSSYLTFISSDILGSSQSILMMTTVVIGGIRSIPGSVLGAVIVITAPELLRVVKQALGLSFDPWPVLYGLLLIVMIRFRPQGILGRGTIYRR